MLVIVSFAVNVVIVGQDLDLHESHSQDQRSESYFNSPLIVILRWTGLSSKFRILGIRARSEIWYITNSIFSLCFEDDKVIIFMEHKVFKKQFQKIKVLE